MQSLETHVCKGDQTNDAFPIEKVKVLSGPNAGLVGWVLAYGLRAAVKP
jgi:hypothetical protein